MIDLTIHIKNVSFLTNSTDKVHIDTNLPSPFPKGVSNDFLTLEFEVQSVVMAKNMLKKFLV